MGWRAGGIGRTIIIEVAAYVLCEPVVCVCMCVRSLRCGIQDVVAFSWGLLLRC